MKYIVLIIITLTSLVNAFESSVLKAGESVNIKNIAGLMVVKAEPKLKRSFTWNGETRSVTMIERDKAWLGSKSIYFPGPGEHWLDNDGITRGVVEEGKREFKNAEEFRKWIMHDYQKYLDFKYIEKGRIGGWALIRERKQMNCVIWEVRINGKLISDSIFKSSIE